MTDAYRHNSPYVSGHYVRGLTRIGLSCRDTIDNLYYEHSFIIEHSSCREIEQFVISHPSLLTTLGHSEACKLVGSNNVPDSIVVRDGGDRVASVDLRPVIVCCSDSPRTIRDLLFNRSARFSRLLDCMSPKKRQPLERHSMRTARELYAMVEN